MKNQVWYPNANKIAFTSNRDGNADIHVMDADSSNPVNLTNNLGDDWIVTWSP
ncbi:MAG TPA: hypothetical protein G4O18_00055 [Dehalococcoidia bacterium]|nr:hypothetical protein [Dehalococcoidia bacterium]